MAEYLSRRWEPRFEGATLADRRGGLYRPYLPDPLAGWNPLIPADLAGELARAEAAVLALNDSGADHFALEGLARFLLRAESVASSWIEGLAVGARRLARAEVAVGSGRDAGDRLAEEIVGNVAAMEAAVDLGSGAEPFGLDELLVLHRILMSRSPTPDIAGRIRGEQNWVGGSWYNPCSAAYVPPPPERLAPLVDDLLDYVNGTLHPPLLQAAVAHAQFETLHPFADGNGRTGRALIHVVLRRRGLAPRFVPPVSLVLARRADDYIGGLVSFRHVGPADGSERSDGLAGWARVFVDAAIQAAEAMSRYSATISDIAERWRGRIGRVRVNSSTDLLLRSLPGVPVITVASAAALTGHSQTSSGEAVNALARAGILRQRDLGRRRYRVFEAPEILDLFGEVQSTITHPDTGPSPA